MKDMPSTNSTEHRGYRLTWSALALDTGKFEPRLSVCSVAWPSRPRKIAVARGDHLTEAAALEAAYAAGMEWIANHG